MKDSVLRTPTFHSQRLSRLGHYAQEQLDKQQFAGIAWCLEHRGEVIEQGCTGYADHALSQPLAENTLYRLYSMTKPIVSVRCLQLVEAGRLRLDDPVSRWIPAFEQQQVLNKDGSLSALARPIVIEDLLTHRSGLSYDFLPDCAVAELYRGAGMATDGSRSLHELATLLGEFPLAFQPGERWYYSYATDVLAHVLECVCDQPIGQSLQENLFSPLGMTETGYQVSEDQHHRVAHMFGLRDLGELDSGTHTQNNLVSVDVSNSYPLAAEGTFARGGVGLYSTLNDYRRFMDVLLSGSSSEGEPILCSPMLDMLWQNRLTTAQMPIAIGNNANPGYGWGLTGRVMSDTTQAFSLSVQGEGGWAGAASTYFWVDRANQFTGIVMAQYLGSTVALGPDMQSLAYAALCSE